MIAHALTALLFLSTGGSPELLRAHDQWRLGSDQTTASVPDTLDGEFQLVVPHDVPLEWYSLVQDIPAESGAIYEASAECRMSDHRGGGAGTYIAVNFMDDEGERIAFEQSSFVPREESWTPLFFRFSPPPGTETIEFHFIHNGTGTAWMRNPSLRLVAPPLQIPDSTHAVLRFAEEPAGRPLIGVGFEDDGWTYNQQNAEMGLNEKDYALREERIREMNPSLVRMFMWYPDWVPGVLEDDYSGPFTFDTDNMHSKYRTLDLYQDIGASVILCGVEWGMPKPSDPAALGESVAALLEHLVVERGYDHIIGWTVTNEPNIHPYFRNFDFFAEATEAVDDAIKRRGLSVPIVASDETNGGRPFFMQCVETESYHERAGFYASHRYFGGADPRLFDLFVKERVRVLEGSTNDVPFILAEFGFLDGRATGPLKNPFTEEPEYALRTADVAIQALAAGAAGLSFWCAHEVYYPGHHADPEDGRMRYGLWNFKDRDFSVRPTFHVMGALTRHARPGMRATRVETDHDAEVGAVLVGPSTLFVLNRCSRELTASLEQPRGMYVLEAWCDGDAAPALVDGVTLRLPPRSFAALSLKERD